MFFKFRELWTSSVREHSVCKAPMNFDRKIGAVRSYPRFLILNFLVAGTEEKIIHH
jgi:hypothetical protein